MLPFSLFLLPLSNISVTNCANLIHSQSINRMRIPTTQKRKSRFREMRVSGPIPTHNVTNAHSEIHPALLDQKTHATISDDVKEIILGPSLHESAYFQAIAPVVDVTDRRDQWRRSAQINLYGLFNDIALNILPTSAIKIAYQTLSNVLSRGVYNKIAAFDVSTFWEDPERVIVHLVDEEVQRLALINVLLRGWKRGGVVQNSDRWTPQNVQLWISQVAIGSDPLRHHKALPQPYANNWLVRRFLVAAQACNLLPKCHWIRHDNAQDWLHLFVPIHHPWVTVPPATKDSAYWSWHTNVARQYWMRCGINDEESLRVNQLWSLYRPHCTPYLFMDVTNTVLPTNKPDYVPAVFFEMVTTRNKKARDRAIAAQDPLQQPQVEEGPVLDEHGRVTSGNLSGHPLDYYLDNQSDSDNGIQDDDTGKESDDDEDGDNDSDDDSDDESFYGRGRKCVIKKVVATRSSVELFREAARNLRKHSSMPGRQQLTAAQAGPQQRIADPSPNNQTRAQPGARVFTNSSPNSQATISAQQQSLHPGFSPLQTSSSRPSSLRTSHTIPLTESQSINDCDNSDGDDEADNEAHKADRSRITALDTSLSWRSRIMQSNRSNSPVRGRGDGSTGGRRGGRGNQQGRGPRRLTDDAATPRNNLRQQAIANSMRDLPSQRPATPSMASRSGRASSNGRTDLTRGFDPIGGTNADQGLQMSNLTEP